MFASPSRRLAAGLGVGLVLAACCLLAEALSAGWGDYLAVGLILCVGFPHGAADLGTVRRLLASRPNYSTIGVIGLYLAAMGATALLWWLTPAVALAAFVLLSVVHFGQEQAHHLGLRGPGAWVYTAGFGTFALLAPLSWSGDTLGPVAAEMGGAAMPDSVLLSVRVLAALGAAVALGFAAARYNAGRQRARWGAELWLLVVLVIVYLSLPSLLGFLVFFVGVHATASIYNQVRFRGWLPTGESLGRFLREAFPYAAIAVASITLLLSVGDLAGSGYAWLGTFFVLVSVFTTPHAVVVWWMTRG